MAKCSDVLAKYKEQINAYLEKMSGKSEAYKGADVPVYSKCAGGEDYEKINSFDKLSGGLWSGFNARAQAYQESGLGNRVRHLENDDGDNCSFFTEQEVAEHITKYMGALARYNYDKIDAMPECSQTETGQAATGQQSAAEDAEELQRKCTKNIRDYGQESDAAKLACKNAQVAAAALTAAADKTAEAAELYYTQRRNLNFKEQCFLLGEIFSIAQKKKVLDEKNIPTTGLSAHPTRTELKPLPYIGNQERNASIVIEGDPFAFINRMTQNIDKRSAFFDMTEAEISNLQPMIRLFKIIEKDDGSGVEEEVEMEFDTSLTDISYFLADSRRRGTGVGIKDFNISYEADNPFAITKSIKAKLTLHAASFDELLRSRVNSKKQSYSYIDLALKTGGSTGKLVELQTAIENNKINSKAANEAIENLSKLLFRLKVVIGWASPVGGASFGGDILSSKLKDAIYQSCITLNLTPTIHEFNFDDTGRIDFTINYLAYVEDFFDQPKFNIFSDPFVAVRQLTRRLQIKELNQKCDSEGASEMKIAQKELVERDRATALRTLVEQMIKSKKICYMTMSLAEMAAYNRDGPQLAAGEYEHIIRQIYAGPTTFGSPTQETREAVNEELALLSDPSTTSSEVAPIDSIRTISFVYLSDLMDVILEGIGGLLEAMPGAIDYNLPNSKEKDREKQNYERYKENFKKYRLVLGPLEINNASKGGEVTNSAFVSLGDVPISMRYFLEWLTKKMLKKDEIIYPLPKFTNDFINELLRNFLNTDQCFNNEARQPTRLSQTALTAYTEDEYDELTEKIMNQKLIEPDMMPRRLRMSRVQPDETPILSVNGNREQNLHNPGIDKEINYMVYYASRTQPVELMNGNRGEDHNRGIWHYQIGRDRGIVKNIQLKKTNSPGLKEVRFEQQGYDGLQQLREMYDATIDCYADVCAFPGNYIYISPDGFSPGAATINMDLTQFGVGGYYMIIRSEHSFGPGKAETIITAKWVAEIESAAARSANSEDKTSSKCDSVKSQREIASQG